MHWLSVFRNASSQHIRACVRVGNDSNCASREIKATGKLMNQLVEA